MIYKISYLWTDCNFQGPIISRASYFIDKPEPQWRYDGSRTFLKSGTHFSWVMSINDMIEKIKKYSHRAENEIFADKGLLTDAVIQKRYLFEPSRPFKIKELNSYESRCYPKSLKFNLKLLPKEVL